MSFQIGLIDAIPYFTASVFAMGLGSFADWLVIHGKLSVTHTRKMLIHISFIGSAIGFVVLGQVGCDYKLAAAVIVMTVTVNTVAITGQMVLYTVNCVFILHLSLKGIQEKFRATFAFIFSYIAWISAPIILEQFSAWLADWVIWLEL